MKKNILYLSLLVLISVICYFAFFGKKKRLFPKEEANFQVERVNKVDKIFLSGVDGRTVRLTKKSEYEWALNDSMTARQDWVELLLDGFEHQNASAPVPESMHDQVVKELAGNGIKCEIFQGDKKTNQFYVSREPGKDNITYMLNITDEGKNAKRPFLVKYGLNNTFLGVRYEPEESTWRSRRILNFPYQDLKSIKIQYPDSAQHNFLMELPADKESDNFKLSGNSTVVEELNLNRVKEYAAFYDGLFCQGYENNYGLKDTLRKAFTPLAMIRIKNTEGKEKSLDIYYRPVYKGTNKILNVRGQQFDGDSFFGWLDEKDFVLISRPTVTKILQAHKDFFGKK